MFIYVVVYRCCGLLIEIDLTRKLKKRVHLDETVPFFQSVSNDFLNHWISAKGSRIHVHKEVNRELDRGSFFFCWIVEKFYSRLQIMLDHIYLTLKAVDVRTGVVRKIVCLISLFTEQSIFLQYIVCTPRLPLIFIKINKTFRTLLWGLAPFLYA